jgi:AcrR family transcriptional regulator
MMKPVQGTQVGRDRRRGAAIPKVSGDKEPGIRDRILAAALDLFSRHGFDGTSLSAIAKQAGVAQPHPYYYFKDKTALWEAAVAPSFDAVLREVREGDDLKDLNDHDRFRVRLRRIIQASIDNVTMMKIYLQESASPGPRLDYIVDTYLKPIHATLEAEIHTAARRSDANPAFILASAVGAVHFFFGTSDLLNRLHGLKVAEGDTRNAFVDFVVDQVLHATMPC